MSLRRLRVLVRGLPPTARLNVALRDRLRAEGAPTTSIEDLPPEAWSQTDWLLADVVDLLALQVWQTSAIHRAEGDAVPEQPEPVARPGVHRPKPRGAGAWFAAFGAAAPVKTDDS